MVQLLCVRERNRHGTRQRLQSHPPQRSFGWEPLTFYAFANSHSQVFILSLNDTGRVILVQKVRKQHGIRQILYKLSLPCFITLSRGKYKNMNLSGSSGEDDSVHPNNASMIEMLTMKKTKFLLYHDDWTTYHTCARFPHSLSPSCKICPLSCSVLYIPTIIVHSLPF